MAAQPLDLKRIDLSLLYLRKDRLHAFEFLAGEFAQLLFETIHALMPREYGVWQHVRP